MATCPECGRILGLFGSDPDALCESCALILEAERMFHQIKALEEQGKTREEIAAAVWERDTTTG